MSQYYLGKQGRISGPYTAEQISQMRASGEILRYTFLWDADREEWRSLEMPPPRPDGGRSPSRKGASGFKGQVEALCYDRVSLVAGRLENVMDGGCELVSLERSAAPKLSIRSNLTLNLLNPKSGESTSVTVQLADALRRDDHWVYRLTWDQIPDLP